MELEKERSRLEKDLGRDQDMDRLPGTIFVVDPKKERIAINEARKDRDPFHRCGRYEL